MKRRWDDRKTPATPPPTRQQVPHHGDPEATPTQAEPHVTEVLL